MDSMEAVYAEGHGCSAPNILLLMVKHIISS